MAARSTRIDALRGFAVFGIMLVNIWGFAHGLMLHRFPSQDTAMPLADQLAIFAVAAFAEQKFYPIFAFLFGAGFALQTGRRRAEGPRLDAVRETYRRRLRWLLVCGILHGTLLWFGDILTAYAVTGFWLVHATGRRLSVLRKTLLLTAIVNAIVLIAYGAVVVALTYLPLSDMITQVVDAERAHAVYSMGSWSDIALMRLMDFGMNVLSFVVYLPRIALLFLLGVFAVRLGYLTRPERHRAFWRKLLLCALGVALPINLWWGAIAVASAIDPFVPAPFAGMIGALTELAGPLMGAGIVSVFMLSRQAVCLWLVPVGRMALTNYLTQSVLLMLLLQGFGFGLGATTRPVGMLGIAFSIMCAQFLFSHWWMARHAQGPIEAVWRRYTYRRKPA